MDDMRRAILAKELLDNPVFTEVFDNAHEQIRAQRMNASITDQDIHSKLILSEQLLDGIRRALVSMVETGELETQELEFREKQKRWYQRG